MGLDSVELLISFEDYFDIKVSTSEAEKIGTVQDMADCTSRHLNITDNSAALKTVLFEKLKSSLIQLQLTDSSFSLSDKIFSILNPNDKESWTKLSEEISLQIPQPFTEADTIIKKVFFVGWQPKYDWKTVTVDQFITAVYASNYEKVIDPGKINTTYQILIAIAAITSDKLGVDPYEVQPEKKFTDDFGID
ncbi:MAG: phosphopantetheine-binding protein [Bacteroidetes bacterium]|jgi:acyl carrier protein|nr:phosphopantetheine-binding protein [Bacteroidota bacterium]